jgi:hypothetical protein
VASGRYRKATRKTFPLHADCTGFVDNSPSLVTVLHILHLRGPRKPSLHFTAQVWLRPEADLSSGTKRGPEDLSRSQYSMIRCGSGFIGAVVLPSYARGTPVTAPCAGLGAHARQHIRWGVYNKVEVQSLRVDCHLTGAPLVHLEELPCRTTRATLRK